MTNNYNYMEMIDVSRKKAYVKVQRMLKKYNNEFDKGERKTNLASLLAQLIELSDILEVEE